MSDRFYLNNAYDCICAQLNAKRFGEPIYHYRDSSCRQALARMRRCFTRRNRYKPMVCVALRVIAPYGNGDALKRWSMSFCLVEYSAMSLQYAYSSNPAAMPLETEDRTEPLRLWFALNVAARHEKSVSHALNQKGFETFLPLYTRRHQYEGRARQFELPLFPGYVFCRAEPATRLPILTTPGVLQILGAGRVPIPIDNHEIDALQKAVEAGIEMSPYPFWQSGQSGRITEGPLSGIEGTIVSVKQSRRLVLSVTLLQRSVLLEIDSKCVSP